MGLTKYITEMAKAAKEAYFALTTVSAAQKNQALSFIAEGLAKQREAILAANEVDMNLARLQGLDAALLDRLQLTGRGIDAMIDGVHQVIALADPYGFGFHPAALGTDFNGIAFTTTTPMINAKRIDRKSVV